MFAAVVEQADTRDLKSLALKSVPVRSRSAAPNNPQPPTGLRIIYCKIRPGSNRLNATRRGRVAREGWTERNNYLRQRRRCKRIDRGSRSPGRGARFGKLAVGASPHPTFIFAFGKMQTNLWRGTDSERIDHGSPAPKERRSLQNSQQFPHQQYCKSTCRLL